MTNGKEKESPPCVNIIFRHAGMHACPAQGHQPERAQDSKESMNGNVLQAALKGTVQF